jgi:hypothetical protein
MIAIKKLLITSIRKISKTVIYIGCLINSPLLVSKIFIISIKKLNNVKYKANTKKKIIYFYRSAGINDLIESFSKIKSENDIFTLERGLLVEIFNYFTGEGVISDFNYKKEGSINNKIKYRFFINKVFELIKKDWNLGGIITSGIFMKADHELIATCKDINIPFIIMQKEGIRSHNERLVEDHYLKHKIPKFEGTKILVYNQDEKNSYIKSGYAKKDQIIINGCARLDTFFKLKKKLPNTKTIAFFLIQNDYGLPIQSGKWHVPSVLKKKIKDKKFSWEIIEKKYFEIIEDFINNNKDYNIIIKTKPIPSLSPSQIKFMNKMKANNVKIFSGGNSYNTIKNSKIIVTFSSTVIFEALAANRILIVAYDLVNTNKSKYILDINKSFLPTKFINKNNLKKLKNQKINIKFKKKIFSKYLGNNNGKSGDRTGKILNNVFQNFGN